MSSIQPILNRLSPTQRVRGVELGTLAGKSAEALLRALPLLELYMVDRWTEFPEDHRYRASGHQEAQHPTRVYERMERKARERTAFADGRAGFIKCDTAEAAARFDDHSVDFVRIDADSTYEGTLENLEAWRTKVKLGGFLTGLSASHHDRDQVDQAVHDFVRRHGLIEHLYHDANTTWFIYPPKAVVRQSRMRPRQAASQEKHNG